MFAKHLSVLCTFACGCLSGAALIGFWPEDAGTSQSPRGRTTEASAPAVAVTSGAGAHAIPDDASGARRSRPQRDPAVPPAVASGHGAQNVDPSSDEVADDAAKDSPMQGGSSVADVLIRLEAAYRVELIATDRALAAPRTVVEEPPRDVPAPSDSAATVVAAPSQNAPRADALLAATVQPEVPRVDAEPRVGPREIAQLRSLHIGDVNHNVYVGDVYQGDVYQLQQFAVLNYLTLLALSSGGQRPSAHAPSRGSTRRAPAFSSSLTNPDNPWGFDFPPTVLVK